VIRQQICDAHVRQLMRDTIQRNLGSGPAERPVDERVSCRQALGLAPFEWVFHGRPVNSLTIESLARRPGRRDQGL